MYHRRHFPPLTNRLLFERQRSPSPDPDLEANITNRAFFPIRVAVPGDLDNAAPTNVGIKPSCRMAFNENVAHPTYMPHSPNESLIIRPSGTLSKPGAGGYSLYQALGWTDDMYKHVQVGGAPMSAG